MDATAEIAETAQLQPPDGPPTYVARVGHYSVLHAGSRVLANGNHCVTVVCGGWAVVGAGEVVEDDVPSVWAGGEATGRLEGED